MGQTTGFGRIFSCSNVQDPLLSFPPTAASALFPLLKLPWLAGAFPFLISHYSFNIEMIDRRLSDFLLLVSRPLSSYLFRPQLGLFSPTPRPGSGPLLQSC